MTDRRSATPNSWRAWLLLTVAVWLSFAPAVVAVMPAQLGQSVTEGPPSAAGVCIYLYAQANPVGMFDPSGNNAISLPGLTFVGTVVGTLARLAVVSIATTLVELPFRGWTIWEGAEPPVFMPTLSPNTATVGPIATTLASRRGRLCSHLRIRSSTMRQEWKRAAFQLRKP